MAGGLARASSSDMFGEKIRLLTSSWRLTINRSTSPGMVAKSRSSASNSPADQWNGTRSTFRLLHAVVRHPTAHAEHAAAS